MVKKLFLILFLFGSQVLAKFTVTAELSETRISIKESTNLIINIQSEGAPPQSTSPEFQAPDFEIANSYTQFSSSSQYINGNFKSITNRTFNFVLFPKKAGNLKISDITIQVGGELKNLPNLSVFVMGDAGSGGGAQTTEEEEESASTQNQTKNNTSQNIEDSRAGDPYLVKGILNPKQAYVGQRMNIDYYFYAKEANTVTDFDLPIIPKFEKFWREEVHFPKTMRWDRVSLSGIPYHRALIVSYALFPLEAGRIKIEPMTSRIEYIKRSERDDIFGGFFQLTKRDRMEVVGGEAFITVNELPNPKPNDFYEGLVGKLDISAELDSSKVESNKAITLRVKAKGDVNLNSLNKLNFSLPKYLEAYEPKIEYEIDHQGGEKRFELLLIPRSGGDFVIPPWTFSVFDPEKKQYYQVSTKELRFHVEGKVLEDEIEKKMEGEASETTKAEIQISSNDLTYTIFRYSVRGLAGLLVLAFVFFISKQAITKAKLKRDQMYKYELWYKKILKMKDLQRAYLEAYNCFVSLLNEKVPEGISIDDKISKIEDEKLRNFFGDYLQVLQNKQFSKIKTELSKEELQRIIQAARRSHLSKRKQENV